MDTLERDWLEKHCRDFGKYPSVITKDMGLDLVISDRPDLLAKPPERFEVELEITSFKGFSPGAVHYYGVLCYVGPTITDGKAIYGGYISEVYKAMGREVTDLYRTIRIEVTRPVTEEEINNDPDRWEGYCEGYSTSSFNTKSALLAVATNIVKLRFPDFKMTISDLT